MLTLKSELIFSIQTIKNRPQIPISIDETFFGIDSKYKVALYDQIFDFVYYSEGAFSFDEVRSMPIAIRIHYLNRLNKTLKEKSDAIKKAQRRR